MPHMAEAQIQDLLAPPGGEQRVLPVSLDLTEKSLAKFSHKLNLYARSKNYFADNKDGTLRSPARIYEMTQDVSAAVLVDNGIQEDVQVFTPPLELHRTKTGNILGSEARSFGMESTRLKAIIALEQAGALSLGRAMELSGGKEPWIALADHKQGWQGFLNRSRSFQAKRAQPRVQDKTPARENSVFYGAGGRGVADNIGHDQYH